MSRYSPAKLNPMPSVTLIGPKKVSSALVTTPGKLSGSENVRTSSAGGVGVGVGLTVGNTVGDTVGDTVGVTVRALSCNYISRDAIKTTPLTFYLGLSVGRIDSPMDWSVHCCIRAVGQHR